MAGLIATETTKALQTWACDQHGALGGDRVALGVTRDANEGVGAIATRDIAVGEHVLSVPAALLLDAYAAQEDPKLGPFLKRHKLCRPGGFYASADEEAWPVILLLALRAHNGPSSPYVNALPGENDLDAASCWTRGELDALLPEYHPVRERALAAQSERETWAERAHAELGLPQTLVRWAASMFWSRALQVPVNSRGQRAQTSAMTPFLDSLNHRAGQLHTLQVSDQGHVLLVAGHAIASGDAVYINYGAKSNFDLLLHYGFVGPSCPEDMSHFEMDGLVFKVRRGTPDLFVFPSGLLDAARQTSRPSLDTAPASNVSSKAPYQDLEPDDEDWVLYFCNLGNPNPTAAAEAAALQYLVQTVRQQLDASSKTVSTAAETGVGSVQSSRRKLATMLYASEMRCLEAMLTASLRLARLIGV
ncbi:Histone-lysine N-methyltransferase setd3 [Hondaea fermentalgiana]|uniref:Histone-lysine N-methyltransferase setd3 n=1 Tax=Hondaea fermentalgiana TaxID=2315210 RepID=A0A2R5GR72_9STRA|nr:Histone-lysine N-methyltransferase setd3 [Hondaea fermentalgiana]|eukprot:GBG33387.1 Histone-lysine N-methyltransferase setd3 [Hondaea fermentalgiana]